MIEAISWILLACFAMPMKYFADNPFWVKTVFGPAHGALFVLFCFLLLFSMLQAKWTFKRALLLFVSSLVLFMPFFFDTWLKDEALKIPKKKATG